MYVELREKVIRGNSPVVQWLTLSSTFTDVAQVQFLAGELRSHTLHDVAKKKKSDEKKSAIFLFMKFLIIGPCLAFLSPASSIEFDF